MFKILSLCDGISCGQVAIKNFNVNYTYVSSEIDPLAIKVTNQNFPDTIQIGDMTKIKYIPYQFDLIMGGTPCQSFSLLGMRKGMVTPENIEVTSYDDYIKYKNEGVSFENSPSALFWEFARAIREGRPKYFLLENTFMQKKWSDVISKELGVEPIPINSSRLTAQNRLRLYWTNIPRVTQPQDLKIKIWDVFDGYKSCGVRGYKNKLTGKYDRVFTVRTDGKANCLITIPHGTNRLIDRNGIDRIMTPQECEILQGLPVGYTNGIPNTARYKAIGNGWTVPVISHIFSYIPEFKPKLRIDLSKTDFDEMERIVQTPI